MEQAIGLITGGAEGAGDAQDPSRTIASERALNGAIVAGYFRLLIRNRRFDKAYRLLTDSNAGAPGE